MKPRVEKVVDQESVRWIEQGARLDAQFFRTAHRDALTEAQDDLARRQVQQVSRHSREVFVWLGIALALLVSLPFAGVTDSPVLASLGISALVIVLGRLGILFTEPSERHR
ncbi:hypothetical protein [Streptosporangium sp. NPDC049644]|uniref:hypothetical protein n=1 Tax=Streptosporangium sp. NPDC049644 TaxID=3155507 RepID=UPI003429A5DB